MKHHTRDVATRLHPDVVRLVRTAACFRITMAWLLIGFVVVVILALLD